MTYDALDHITKLVTSCAGCEEVLSTYEYTYNDQGYIISEKATESLAGYVYDDKHDGKHEDGKHDSEYPHGNKHNGKHDKDGTNAIRVVTTERFYEYDENWQLTKCTEKEENKGTNTYSYEYDSVAGVTVPVAWESVAMVGTGAVTVRSAFGNMFKVSISKSNSGNTNSLEGESET